MAQQLNSTTQGIQALRTNVQQDIATSVTSANADMTQIANLNTQLQGLSPTDPSTATLEDQRDTAINQLSQLMDVRVSTGSNNQVSIYTNSGVQLVGAQASKLSFNGPATLGASNLYSTNPTQNGVGTITLTSPSGATTDMNATNGFSSGQIAADLQLRDTTLVQAQNQVDQLAASMSSALSDTTTAGTAVTSGTQAGFTLDLTQHAAGQHHQSDLYQHRDQYPAAAADRRRQQFFGAAIADPLEHKPQHGGDRRQCFGRHGLDRLAIERGAGRRQPAIFQPVRLDVAGAQWHRDRLCRQFGLGDHHDLVADQRQPGAAALYRRQCSLYGSHQQQRFADDGICRPHHREPRGGRQSVEPHRLQHVAADRVRRHHARGLHQFAIDLPARSPFRR